MFVEPHQKTEKIGGTNNKSGGALKETTASDDEYAKLLESVQDKQGLKAIKALHEQLDDDHDGTIEPSETGDFIKADLQVSVEYHLRLHSYSVSS